MFNFYLLPIKTFSLVEISFLFLALIISAYQDIKTRKISNIVPYSTFVFFFIYFFIFKGFEGLIFHLLGFLIVSSFGLLLFYFRALGGGDIKLLILLGFIFPLDSLPRLFFMIILIGGCQGVWGLFHKNKTIPYALSILIGTILYISLNYF
ncbi:prepilin peptidase [Candidatus Gracilibacteria bacterium]|nr:prepilin peptidase [Candidatus Gracilibacteria bacterium]